MLAALFGFRGRLSRAGFWEAVLAILLVDVLIVLASLYVADGGLAAGKGLLKAAPWALTILTVWGSLATSIKRLHDRGRTGWLILVALIPVIGWLWLLVDLFLLEGDESRNRYGRPPHAAPGQDAPRTRFDWDAEPVAPAAFAAAPAASAFDWRQAPAPVEHNDAPALHEVHEDPVPEPAPEVQELQDARDEPAEVHEANDEVHEAVEAAQPEPEAHPVEPEVHAEPPADRVLDVAHDPAPPAIPHPAPEDDEPLQILTH